MLHTSRDRSRHGRDHVFDCGSKPARTDEKNARASPASGLTRRPVSPSRDGRERINTKNRYARRQYAAVCCAYGFGFTRDINTGRRINPWDKPSVMHKKSCRKNVMNTYDCDPPSTATARNVEKAPLKTAAPMLFKHAFSRSSGEPLVSKYARPMCAA
eukprot:30878-Pelagococcus_subviridis.AAC.5